MSLTSSDKALNLTMSRPTMVSDLWNIQTLWVILNPTSNENCFHHTLCSDKDCKYK